MPRIKFAIVPVGAELLHDWLRIAPDQLPPPPRACIERRPVAEEPLTALSFLAKERR